MTIIFQSFSISSQQSSTRFQRLSFEIKAFAKQAPSKNKNRFNCIQREGKNSALGSSVTLVKSPVVSELKIACCFLHQRFINIQHLFAMMDSYRIFQSPYHIMKVEVLCTERTHIVLL